MDLIETIEIVNPPYKFSKYNSKKKVKEDHYLSANLYFTRDQWLKNSIKKECLRYLYPHFKGLPKLSKMRIDIEVHSYKTQFDLDNKAYYWIKIVLDLLKTPSSKQLKNAYLKGNDIVSVNVLDDDTVKFVDAINMRYVSGGDKLVFKIYGVLLEVQGKLL